MNLDALMDELADRVVAKLRPMIEAMPGRTADTSAPLLMRRSDYAERVGLSVRTLDSELPADCYAGQGRLKRVVVGKADAHILGLRCVDSEPSQDTIVALARATARRAR